MDRLFEAAQQISGVLSALEASQAPVMTPYSGFSVFVAAHINMYGTIAPLRYPGGLERAEEEKSRNLVYLERLSRLWPVGRSWVSANIYPYAFIGYLRKVYSGERPKKRTDSMRQSRVLKFPQTRVYTVQGSLRWQVP